MSIYTNAPVRLCGRLAFMSRHVRPMPASKRALVYTDAPDMRLPCGDHAVDVRCPGAALLVDFDTELPLLARSTCRGPRGG